MAHRDAAHFCPAEGLMTDATITSPHEWPDGERDLLNPSSELRKRLRGHKTFL